MTLPSTQCCARPTASTRLLWTWTPLDTDSSGQGAVIGTEGVRVTNMLCADDLSFTTDRTDQMQCMLDKLIGYAARKGLTVSVAKLEVVHSDSCAGSHLPTFRYGEDQLANTGSFKYWACTLLALAAWLQQLGVGSMGVWRRRAGGEFGRLGAWNPPDPHQL
eukprot:scaffold116998_cov19-Tisochrysis_lutea.AAC.1